MKKCKACQKEIDVKASKCPYCQSDQRNWFIRHPIWTTLIVFLVIGLVGSASDRKSNAKTTPSIKTTETMNVVTEAEKQENNKPKQWATVTELSGNANKRSDTFELYGGKAKLTYTFDGGQFVAGTVYVLKEGESLEENGGI